MIISCPSCGTCYRHRADPGGASNARCSSCEQVFPLSGGARHYVVRAVGAEESRPYSPRAVPAAVPTSAPGPAPGRLAFGMDDPSLADRIGRTALDAAPGRPTPSLTYRLQTEPTREPEPELDAAPTPVPSHEPETSVRRGRGGVAVRLLALVLGAAAPTAGWWMSTRYGGDPLQWTLGGGAVGLFVLWMGLRWKPRNS